MLPQVLRLYMADVVSSANDMKLELLHCWNFVPAINDEGPGGLEHYRAFCQGRSLAFEESYGRGFTTLVPAASAVGCGPAALTVAFAACEARRLIVLPLLFSDGYFFGKRLKPFVTGPAQTLAAPLALWPSFAPFLSDNLALRTISHAADPRVALIAHGSKTPGRSAACARIVAQQMQAQYGRIEVGFLEEPPLAVEVAAQMEAPWAAVGLFLGEGMHGGEDFDVLVATAAQPPVAAFTAGELPGLGRLIAAQARELLG